jgi:AcrR family transcriptional regulator
MIPPDPQLLSDPTRSRLIQAAGEVFADHGYHRATVRHITERAAANVAAVNYYFRDKAELYATCLRAAHSETGPEQPVPPLVRSHPPEVLLFHFIDQFVRRVTNPDRPQWHHRIMAREMAEPTEMLDEMVRDVIRPSADELGIIIAGFGGGNLSSHERWMLGFSVVSQALFYSCHRAIVTRLAPEFETQPPPAELIVQHIYDFSVAGMRARIAAANERRGEGRP